MHISSQKNNVSFGLSPSNAKNIAVIADSAIPEKLKTEAIRALDMSDPDKNPILLLFKKLLNSSGTSNINLSAVLDKMAELKTAPEKISEYFTNILKNWGTFFKPIREKSAKILEQNGLSHPKIGGLSRSAFGPQGVFVNRNIALAREYIEKNCQKGVCPDKQLLLDLHRIITKDIAYYPQNSTKPIFSEQYGGIINGSAKDTLGLPKPQKDLEAEIDKVMKWLKNNYNKQNVFELSAKLYKKLLSATPFHDANGRTLRAFNDALLFSKGVKIDPYPSNFAEVRSMPAEELTKLITSHSVPS